MADLRSISARFTAVVLAWRWPVLAAVAAAVVGACFLLPRVSVSTSMAAYVDADDPAVAFYREQGERFGALEYLFVLLVPDEATAGIASDRLQAVEAAVARHPDIVQTVMPGEGADAPGAAAAPAAAGGEAALVVAALDRRATDMRARMEAARDIRARVASMSTPGMAVHVAGLPAVALDSLQQTRADFRTFLWLMPVLLGLVLLAYYRRNWCVFIPPVVIGVAVLLAVALFAAAGNTFDMIGIAFPVVVAVVVFADLIHIVHRYHVELEAGAERADSGKAAAIVRTMAAMNIACFMTSLTTAAGFFALSLSPVDAVATFGQWTALAAMLGYLVVVLLAPVLLMLLPAPGPAMRARYFRGRTLRLVNRLPALARSRKVPVAFALVAVAALAGMRDIEVKTDMAAFLPDSLPAVTALDALRGAGMGGATVQVVVDVRSGTFGGIEALERVRQLQRQLEERFTAVQRTFSLADVLFPADDAARHPTTDVDVEEALLRLELTMDERWLGRMVTDSRDGLMIDLYLARQDNAELNRLLTDIDRWLGRAVPADWQARTTGMLKLYAEQSRELLESKLTSFLFTLVFVALVLLAFLREFQLTLIAVAANVLPVLITLGVMGVTATGLNMVTVMMSSIVIALAVDDTIHLIAAHRDARADGLTGGTAIERAVSGAGFAIVVSSLALLAGFGVFLFAGLASVRDFGLMMGVAVTSAVAVDLLLLVHLLDRRAAAKEG